MLHVLNQLLQSQKRGLGVAALQQFTYNNQQRFLKEALPCMGKVFNTYFTVKTRTIDQGVSCRQMQLHLVFALQHALVLCNASC